ncbi:hypothetical protein L6452_24615 [Arctium lappa]|uniref:Uncharacterized protein n=1 Tax=Arctium lappa TaxID=4217 RepID=A0ACB9AAC7_ARCLA|nr:hypothetical protein L6452_24615 [Arctium lappa]
MSSPPKTLHFAVFPLPAQGHMVPMIDIARILAHHGCTITIITTPVNANRFNSVIERAIEHKLDIRVVELELRLADVGLPEGCESLDMLSSADPWFKLLGAIDMLEEPAEQVLRGLSPAPDCIISDNFIPWTTDVARRLNIPRLVFHGPGCFSILCMHIATSTNMFDGIESDSQPFVLPGLPHRIEVTKLQAFGNSKPNTAKPRDPDTSEAKTYIERVREGEKAAYGILVNSFKELEPEYAQELAKAKDKKVWCIGPVSLFNKSDLDIAERGNKATINEHDCLKWLEGREPGSVVYVCLGTLTHTSTEQIIELGSGLEMTGVPFVWCIRNKTEELAKWFSESGFVERVGDQGLIIYGWAPQVLILSHRAIGGFLTHCGWNSTLEAICSGVPMVTWPHFADQFYNEKFIVQVLKIGVRIGVEIPVVMGGQDTIETLVKKEEVKVAIECLMNGGDEGEERRKRARELAETAKRAMNDGGSSILNMTSMIQDITEQLAVNE